MTEAYKLKFPVTQSQDTFDSYLGLILPYVSKKRNIGKETITPELLQAWKSEFKALRKKSEATPVSTTPTSAS